MAGAGVGSIGAGAAVPAAATTSAKRAATAASAAIVDKNSLVDQLLKKQQPPTALPVSLNVITPASAANTPASSGHVGTNINTSA